MRNFTIRNVSAACGGVYRGDPAKMDVEISSVTCDSRDVAPGCLFAAMAGERTDGHRYVAAALAAGALCALTERVPDGVAGGYILTGSTTAALQAAAAFYRRQFAIPVIGVTGSVGKTTAKEMLAAVLSQRYSVHKTPENLNNDIGVPLSVLGLRDGHTAAVIEMGISHFGDMKRLADIVRPNIAVFTVIGDAHLEYLGSREGVLREKSVMLEGMSADGTVLCNGDDALLAGMDCGALEKLTFGLGEGCDVRAAGISAAPDGSTECEISAAGRRLHIRIGAYGRHMVYAALAAAAAGIRLGLSDSEIIRGIASYEPVGRRARVVDTGRIRIIDDCYNANPTSVAAAIASMSELSGRRVCILGDMLELGEGSARLHRETGHLAASSGAALVLTCGDRARDICAGAGEAGRHFDTKEELIFALPELIREGDTVLVKASRAMKFEDVAEALKKI